MAVGIAGRAAPLAFAIGSLVAVVAGYSYVKLALGFRSDGASFTYLERAFPEHPNVSGVAGWVVVIGYVGTLALYAYTFGIYGAHLLGGAESNAIRIGLSAAVLLFFMMVNVVGAKASGRTEDLIVLTKVVLLAVFVGWSPSDEPEASASNFDCSRDEPKHKSHIPSEGRLNVLFAMEVLGFQTRKFAVRLEMLGECEVSEVLAVGAVTSVR